jgi:anti-sigma factor RsiW
MKTLCCEEFRTFIDPYLDGEFDEGERAAFDTHIVGCGECRRFFEQRVWMQKALRPALRRPCPLPSAARGRIEDRLRSAERPERARRMVRRVVFPLPAVALIGGIFLLVTPLTGFKPSVMDEVVDQHCHQMPVEVPSPEAREIEQWFVGKVPFEMVTPPFRDQRVSLLGGRLSRIHRGVERGSIPAAHLIYSVGPHKLSVLVFDDGGAINYEEAPLALGKKVLRFHEARGHRVAMYRTGDLTYAVTSNMPKKDLLEVIETSL